MFSSFRNRFGIPGVISVIALVFAMFGGAYAASNSGGGDATASAKKNLAKKGARGPKGAKGAPGATGPAGPAGPAGPQGPGGAKGADGANGSDGANGANGSNGVNGKTVLSGTTTPTGGVGTDGDFYIETDVSKIYGPKAAGTWPAGVELKGPKGDEGSPWTAGGTLPAGKTLTGAWAFGPVPPTTTFAEVRVPISFPVRLPATLDAAHVHHTGSTNFAANCTGTANNPTAAPGHLCVYTGAFLNGSYASTPIYPAHNSAFGGAGASTAGAVLQFNSTHATSPGFGNGAFAVTAPNP